MRRASDRQVREVLASFDRWAEEFKDQHPAPLCGFMSAVAGTAIERFEKPGGWSADAMRAVLVVFCLNAPAQDFAEMVRAARRERVDLDPGGDWRAVATGAA